MPISSKKIIQVIENLPDTFSRSELQNSLMQQKPGNKGAEPKGTKKKSQRPKRDLARIDETVSALIRIGYLKKSKKVLKKSGTVTAEGTLNVNTSGDSCMECLGENVIIKKDKRNSASDNDTVVVKITDFRRGNFYGEVSRITRRHKEQYTAKVIRKSGPLLHLSILDMPSDVEACCRRESKRPAPGDYAIISLTGASISKKPECEIIHYFSEDNEDYDFLRIKNRHSLPEDYEDEDIPSDPASLVPQSELRNRKDFTRLFTVTIDGDTAKDFDDAISIKKGRKDTVLYVHIADVSAYVLPGSRLDSGAYSRGTSYYLGNRVIPMLPEALSNDLCSLREGEKRLTMTAEMTFDKNGNMTDFRAYRGIIKVNKRLTYNEAERILRRKSLTKVSDNLHKMWELAKTLTEKRSTEGRLDLNLTDQEIIYDQNRVSEIKFSKRLKSHTLIEECMLSANEAVSKALRENNVPSLYRVHEKISIENLISLKKFFSVIGVKLPGKGNTGRNLQQVLQKVSGKPYEQVVNLVILKSMMQAFYGAEPLGHFGLGFADYTHFTSPIRRYPDLIVHRCLKSLIDSSAPPYKIGELAEIGEKSSLLERVAQKAERDLIKLKSCRIMKDHIGDEFDVIISGMTKFGLFVSLIDMPIEGMVPLKNLTDDYYILQEEDYTVVGRRYKKRYRLGDRIKVKLASADIDTLRIDFEPVQEKRRTRRR